MKAKVLLEKKIYLLSEVAINTLENNFEGIQMNKDVKDYGMTFHMVADYYSKILSERSDSSAKTFCTSIVCPIVLMFIKILITRCFRSKLKNISEKKKFRLLMIMKFSIYSSDLQTKKKRTSK